MGRKKDGTASIGLTLLALTIVLGVVYCDEVVKVQDTNVTTTEAAAAASVAGPGSPVLMVTDGDQNRRADDAIERVSFSGDAEFDARRPRGLLAALFGYPDEFDNGDTPASDSAYGVQEDATGRAGGTPPPGFKASHYHASKKPALLGKTLTAMRQPTTTESPIRTSSEPSEDAVDQARIASTESSDSKNTSSNAGEDGDNDKVEGRTGGNKREVTNFAQGGPLPAGYILWHPVPASFLIGQDGGAMVLSPSETKQQMVPHRPFFVQPNMNAPAVLNPFTDTDLLKAPLSTVQPVDNKAATKLHRQMERQRNRERKKNAKKERQQKEQQPAKQPEAGFEQHAQPQPPRPTPPLHLMLPPLPMNGFPNGPFHVQNNGGGGPFEHGTERPMPNQFNNEFQRPIPPQQQQQGLQSGQLNMEPRPQSDTNPFQNRPHFENHNNRPKFENDRPFDNNRPQNSRPQNLPFNDNRPQNLPFDNNRPQNFAFDNNNSPQNRPFDNNRHQTRPFDNDRPQNLPFDNVNNNNNNLQLQNSNNHNVQFENNINDNNHRAMDFAPIPDNFPPRPTPTAHPAKFEIENRQRLAQHHMEMQKQFQRGPLDPLPPPPPPNFPPPHFPPPFNDPRPFPELPPPPPPPPLGSPSRDTGHGFRDSTSHQNQEQHFDIPFASSARPTFVHGGNGVHDREQMRSSDVRHEPPSPSSTRAPSMETTAQFRFHADAPTPAHVHTGPPDLDFDQTSRSPAHSPRHIGPADAFPRIPPLSAPPAPHPGLNRDNQPERQIEPFASQNNNIGHIYARDFKKDLAEANIALPSQDIGPATANQDKSNSDATSTVSRSTSTTSMPPSTFGLPPNMVTTPTPAPHRQPRPALQIEATTASQQQQKPFVEESRRSHLHQESPAASHRLPQVDVHPNLPDFVPQSSTVRSDHDTTSSRSSSDELQKERSSTPTDSYRSPGFHTGHKGFPSSVTAPNRVSTSEFDEESTRYVSTPAKALPTIKSSMQPSAVTSPAYGYVRHSQSSRSQPTASFSYEIKYQSPAPAMITSTSTSSSRSDTTAAVAAAEEQQQKRDGIWQRPANYRRRQQQQQT